MQKDKENNRIVTIKQDWSWYYALLYMQNLELYPVLTNDETFCVMYQNIMNYLDEKTQTPPYDGDIVEACIMIERYERG